MVPKVYKNVARDQDSRTLGSDFESATVYVYVGLPIVLTLLSVENILDMKSVSLLRKSLVMDLGWTLVLITMAMDVIVLSKLILLELW